MNSPKYNEKLIYTARTHGVSWSDIAKNYGVSHQAIIQYAIKVGIWNKLENRRSKKLKEMKKTNTTS